MSCRLCGRWRNEVFHCLIAVSDLPEVTHAQDTVVLCIRCGPDEDLILDVVLREDGARNSG